MKFTIATIVALAGAAAAEAAACGAPGAACTKREVMDLVEARNAAEIIKAEDYFKNMEARNADPAVYKTHGGRLYTCGVWGNACGKRDLEYLGIMERDPAVYKTNGGKMYTCGVWGSACGKREIFDKINARNAERTANAKAILARNASPAVYKTNGGKMYTCGVWGSACGKRDLEELDVLAPEFETHEE